VYNLHNEKDCILARYAPEYLTLTRNDMLNRRNLKKPGTLALGALAPSNAA
jgi:hypothetical protein